MIDRDLRVSLLRSVVGAAANVPESPHQWESWLWNARFERVVPLLYHSVASGDVAMEEHARQRLVQAQGDVMASAVTLEHHLLEVVRSLDEAGIDHAVLKGVATTHLDYPDPTWRQFGDVDVLVRPGTLSTAREIMEATGWRQGYALPRHHERFAHAITFVRGGVEVDVHQHIAHRALGLLVPTHELFAERVTFDIATRRLFALSAHDRLIHAALHAFTSRNTTKRLSSVADVLLLAHRYGHSAEAVLSRSERWRIRGVVEAGIKAAYGAADVPLPPEWRGAMGQPIEAKDRLVDRAYLTSAHRPLLEEAAYLRLMTSWRDRFRYISGHLSVGPAYAAEHDHGTLRRRVRYLWTKSWRRFAR